MIHLLFMLPSFRYFIYLLRWLCHHKYSWFIHNSICSISSGFTLRYVHTCILTANQWFLAMFHHKIDEYLLVWTKLILHTLTLKKYQLEFIFAFVVQLSFNIWQSNNLGGVAKILYDSTCILLSWDLSKWWSQFSFSYPPLTIRRPWQLKNLNTCSLKRCQSWRFSGNTIMADQICDVLRVSTNTVPLLAGSY